MLENLVWYGSHIFLRLALLLPKDKLCYYYFIIVKVCAYI